ncbi:MAG: coproporphyrinogen III oxidase, partial [Anaerolineae bacterium]|nr:coproporphyrinogen III oxidase [Anaerolineae bacterium]
MVIYLHIPFCRTKCAYCALNSIGQHPGALRRYTQALRRELRSAAGGQAVTAIYFGGGTPALLAPEMVGALLE